MKYTKSRSTMNKTAGSRFPWVWIFAILAVAFVALAIIWMIASNDSSENTEADADTSVFVDDEAQPVFDDEMEEIDFEQIDLTDPNGRGYTGISRRGISDDLFTHVVVAELPAIDQNRYFYEGWLVQPGVLQFFSTGEMFLREDGKWGLVWEITEADQDVEVVDYIRAVITLEPRDGDPAPAPDHVLEGDFVVDIEFEGGLPF